MKRSIELMAVAAVVLLFGFATSAPAQTLFGVNLRPPQTPGVTVQPGPPSMNSGVGRVFVPDSSIAKPGSAGVSAHTNVEVFVPEGFKPDDVYPPFSGYGYNTPASIACRYVVQSGTHVPKCNPNAAGLTNPSGGSQTIAIVDAYDDPWIAIDLAYFSAAFGLPFSPSTIKVVYANGFEPSEDLTGGWELEESLDVEYAHAMAPNATIVLVEANTSSYSDLLKAVDVAGCEVVYGNASCTGSPTGTGEVNMSWGSGEFSGETTYDTHFQIPGAVYFAASGDSPGVSYPCASVNVVCVGGTTFARFPASTPNNSVAQSPFAGQQEGSWENAGGGSSLYESIPAIQSTVLGATLSALYNSTAPTPSGSAVGVGLSTATRATPDLSANANPNTGYWVFDSFDFKLNGYGSAPAGWWIVGGTSASTPIVAGITNLAGTAHGFQASSAAELGVIYGNISSGYPSTPTTGNYNDILSGYGLCGPYQGYTAASGWDPCTGVGVPQGTGGL